MDATWKMTNAVRETGRQERGNVEPGLESAFLRYIGVTSESQVQLRRFYLPMFEGCRRVVDLGCGGGDFVQLLIGAGVEGAFGVDSDPRQCDDLRARNVPVVEQDALSFVESADKDSLDGIYSAHLVEHLPYQKVLELIRHSFRALRPEGRLVLATPNPRALITHLELYHMHFGHEALYHPRLLMFFLDYCGFKDIEDGENPESTSFNLGKVHPTSSSSFGDLAPPSNIRGFGNVTIDPRWEHSLSGNVPLRRFLRWWKRLALKFVVWPLAGDFLKQVTQILQAKQAELEHLKEVSRRADLSVRRVEGAMRHIDGLLLHLDRPFECYVIGCKRTARPDI